MPLFYDQGNLLQCAKGFVLARVESLEKDVRHCLFQHGPDAPAPFPALLYCFSTIDLLGALYCGNACDRAPTSDQSKAYMMDFMGYTPEQADRLQKMFRHKLVHLAQPNPVFKHASMRISWAYYHECADRHLWLQKLANKEQIPLRQTEKYTEVDHIFHIGIFDLVRDIKDSMEGPDGYLATLEKDEKLRNNFDKAISQIYELEDP